MTMLLMNSSHRRSSCSSSRSISPASFFLCSSERVDLAQVSRRCSRLMTASNVAAAVSPMICSMAVRLASSAASSRPVLGEQGHQPIRQVGLHLSQQFSEGSRAGGLDPGSDCSHPAGSPG